MPFINSRGDVAHGVGGGMCNLNNQPVAFGGVLGWWDDDTIAFCHGDNNWLVSLYHVPTKTIVVIDEKYGGPVGGVSANKGYASNNKHACWWFGTNDPAKVGIWSTVGYRNTVGGLMGMGADGAIGYKPEYQSSGPTMYRRLDGTEFQLTLGSTDSLCLLEQDRALWLENGQIHTTPNFPPPLTDEGGMWMTYVSFCAGEWWFSCYHGKHGVVLYPFGKLVGYSIQATGNNWHTHRVLSDGIIRVACSTGIGEQAGEIWLRDYDVTRNLVRNPWGDNAWTPVSRVDITKINYVEPPAQALAFTLDKTTGPSPLTVTATIQQTGLTTWRWLLNEIIHQPIDGNTHTFVLDAPSTYSLGVRGSGAAGTIAATPQNVSVTQPAAIGEASISVDQTTGTVPMTVVAALTQKNLTTWRWLLNGTIDQPIDGLTHSFTITTPGDYTISVRGSAPAGTITSNTIRITAKAAPTFLPGTRSVQAGFGGLVGNDASGTNVFVHLKSVNWDMARISSAADPVLNAAMVKEVKDAGARPIVLCLPEHIPAIPEYVDIEILNEPDIGGGSWPKKTPAEYAAIINQWAPVAQARHQRVWTGGISNPSTAGLSWLRSTLSLITVPIEGVCIHRYPENPGDVPSTPRKDYTSRQAEMSAIQQVVGRYTWGVTESAYSVAPYDGPLTFWEKIKKLFGWKPAQITFTDQQQADYAKQECALFLAAGAQFWTWYQVWEDDTPDVGLMRQNRTWKLVSEIFK